MDKVVFPSMKSLESLRSVKGFVPVHSKTFSIPSSRPSSDASLGCFANLKLTAEKLVKEQASVKMDLELANSKLKKAVEQIHLLEKKLQDANNENAKLKVKQIEDLKLWRGLDSKLSSTKTLCNQLTDTLQNLAGQTSNAEEDKKFFEAKIIENSKSLDDLKSDVDLLSGKLELAEESIKKREQDFLQLIKEKEEIEKILKSERSATECCKKENDAIIKQLNETVKENKGQLEDLTFKTQGLQHELHLKEDECKSFEVTRKILINEASVLQSTNDNLAKNLIASKQEVEHLENAVESLKLKATEVDKHSITVSKHFDQLCTSMEICNKLYQQEKNLSTICAKTNFEKLQNQQQSIMTEKEALSTENKMLKDKIIELQKAQEFIMMQHAEECRLTEDKCRTLESEAANILSKKNSLDSLVAEFQEKINQLTESSSKFQNETKELLLKLSRLESEKQDLQEKMQLMSVENTDKIEKLQGIILEHEENISLMENQVNELRSVSDEKHQANIELVDRNKLLEEQKAEVGALLDSAGSNLNEVRKQYELMLEGKQLELSKHLKEISHKNDQAINDIRKKYEMEKLEIINGEKDKASNRVNEIERKCDVKIKEIEEEAKQKLEHVQAEHSVKIIEIQQERDQTEVKLRDYYKDEMQRIQLQAETELRERTLSLKKEYEIQIISLRQQQQDELEKLQEELKHQHSKGEKQREQLQMPWKVMDDKSQQNDVEVTSKKEYSVSSTRRDIDCEKGSQLLRSNRTDKRKEVNISGIMRTPVANMLRKVDKGEQESLISVPKHSRKVTHREYEIETSNGKTVTKRKKTKSTVMFGDPSECKRVKRRTPVSRKEVAQPTMEKERAPPRSSNIGDLFREGSLNPYADDPYAFD